MNTREDRLSESMQKTPPSRIRKFFEMLIGHDDVISLSVGEPDFPTPWAIREEAFYHLEKGHTSYTSNWGLIELREEIAKYLLDNIEKIEQNTYTDCEGLTYNTVHFKTI